MHLGKHLCFRGGRNKDGERERNRGKMHLEWDHCLPAGMCVGKAGEHRAFVTLKSFQAGYLWRLTSRSLLGCWVPVPTGSALSFSLFPTICCHKFPQASSALEYSFSPWWKTRGRETQPQPAAAWGWQGCKVCPCTAASGELWVLQKHPWVPAVLGTPCPGLDWGRMGS